LHDPRGARDTSAGRALIAARRDVLRPTLDRHAERGEPRLALLAILNEVKRLTAEGQGERWLFDEDDIVRGKAADALALLLTLLAPYAPDAIRAFAIFEGGPPAQLADAEAALDRPLVARPLRWPD
jgi:hypothetical protein